MLVKEQMWVKPNNLCINAFTNILRPSSSGINNSSIHPHLNATQHSFEYKDMFFVQRYWTKNMSLNEVAKKPSMYAGKTLH